MQRNIQAGKYTYMQRCRDTERLRRIKTGIETKRQIEIQTYRQTNRQTDRKRIQVSRKAGRPRGSANK